MKKALLFFLLFEAGCGGGETARPRLAKPGERAPDLRLTRLVNAPLSSVEGWSALGGKAAVLLFWAGWCESCAGPVSRLGALAEKFSAEPVVFIAVTDETEAEVAEYLRRSPSRAWFAAEAGPEVFRSFRVYGRPYAALVYGDGQVAALKADGEVGEEEVRRLLRGSPRAEAVPPGGKPERGEILAEFHLSEAGAYKGSGSFGADGLKAAGMPLSYALDYVFGRADKLEVRPSARLAMESYYDIRLQFPKGRGERHKREFFLKGLETALGLKVKEAQKDAEVWVLRVAPGGPLNMRKREGSGSVRFEGSRCVVEGGSLSVLCEALSARMGEPVRDETGLQGGYSYAFDFREGEARLFPALLSAQLGLRLERRLRKLKVLEVSRPEP